MLIQKGREAGPFWGTWKFECVSESFSWSESSDGQHGSQFMVNRCEVRLFKLCKRDGLLMVKNLQGSCTQRTDNFLLKNYTSLLSLGPGKATPEERDYGRERNIRVAVIPTLTKVRIIFSCGGCSVGGWCGHSFIYPHGMRICSFVSIV